MSEIKNMLLFSELIVTPEAEQLFVSYNSQRRDNLSLTVVLLKTNVIYLFAHLTTIKPPFVCKLEIAFSNCCSVYVAPSLRQVLCIADDSRCAIFATKLLNSAWPGEIAGFRASNSFPISSLRFVDGAMAASYDFAAFQRQMAFWWDPRHWNPFVIIVESNGFHVIDARRTDQTRRASP
jgi:hypothetical protein